MLQTAVLPDEGLPVFCIPGDLPCVIYRPSARRRGDPRNTFPVDDESALIASARYSNGAGVVDSETLAVDAERGHFETKRFSFCGTSRKQPEYSRSVHGPRDFNLHSASGRTRFCPARHRVYMRAHSRGATDIPAGRMGVVKHLMSGRVAGSFVRPS